MRDVTKLDWKFMNDDVRAEVLLAQVTEAVESEWGDEYTIKAIKKILAVKNGTHLGINLTEDDEDTEDLDLTPVKFLDRVIDFHYGNMV